MVVVFENVLLENGEEISDLLFCQILMDWDQRFRGVGPNLYDAVAEVVDNVLANVL